MGYLLGWSLHWVIIAALGDLLPSNLAAPAANAYWIGGLTGFIALIAFAAPPILSLRQITPAATLNENYNSTFSLVWTNAIGFAAIISLVYLYSNSLLLTAYLTLGGLICLSGVYLLSRAGIHLIGLIIPNVSRSWRLGLNNLRRHKQSNAMQIMVFAILFLLITLLISVRTQLINQWQNQLPEGAPNHFAFNLSLIHI